MSELQVANRLHRSGAIDYNVSYDLNTAAAYSTPSDKRKWFDDKTSNDHLSVCEGEPIYSKKKMKKNRHSLQSMGRSPIEAISSVNGFGGLSDEKILKLPSKVKEMIQTSNIPENFAICEVLRDAFFSEVKYTGIAVSPWSYDRKGKQGELFVATLGGANTIYVDEDVEAGDTLVVDLPQLNNAQFKKSLDDIQSVNFSSQLVNEDSPVKFVKWQHKKGMPKTKQTLVVRRLPTIRNATPSPEELRHYRKVRQNFFRRGQVVGMCTRGALAGERADVVLGHSCVGMWNSADLCMC